MGNEGSLDVRLSQACALVRQRVSEPPAIGVVLGSGLGSFADSLEEAVGIPYQDIPHMPTTTVVGHAGQLRIGAVEGVRVGCLQGRVHMYEGHEPERVVFGARLLAKLGCSAVLLTNAAGGLRQSFHPGTLMLITDHLNLTGRNPLLGPNEEALGPRFPDMTCAYDAALRAEVLVAAGEAGVGLEQGVYAALLGPSYETPAEIRMLRTLGADAVGMSTVPEVTALRHMGVRTVGISCITNMAAGMGAAALDHSEVERTARATRDAFIRLLARSVRRMGALLRAEAAGGAR
jgi:purine-nucleoside phosphorylase